MDSKTYSKDDSKPNVTIAISLSRDLLRTIEEARLRHGERNRSAFYRFLILLGLDALEKRGGNDENRLSRK